MRTSCDVKEEGCVAQREAAGGGVDGSDEGDEGDEAGSVDEDDEGDAAGVDGRGGGGEDDGTGDSSPASAPGSKWRST
jgi:hypothetical protein